MTNLYKFRPNFRLHKNVLSTPCTATLPFIFSPCTLPVHFLLSKVSPLNFYIVTTDYFVDLRETNKNVASSAYLGKTLRSRHVFINSKTTFFGVKGQSEVLTFGRDATIFKVPSFELNLVSLNRLKSECEASLLVSAESDRPMMTAKNKI